MPSSSLSTWLFVGAALTGDGDPLPDLSMPSLAVQPTSRYPNMNAVIDPATRLIFLVIVLIEIGRNVIVSLFLVDQLFLFRCRGRLVLCLVRRLALLSSDL